MQQRHTIVTTDRLAVTTWLPTDIDDMFALHSDPETMRFVGPGRPESRQEVEQRLDTYLREQQSRGWTKWRVQDRQGEMIGRAGFGGFGNNRELGYTLRREVWGLGYATELAITLVRWHRTHLDDGMPADLWAYAAMGNLPSRRVLEKAGFTFAEERQHNKMPCGFYVLQPTSD